MSCAIELEHYFLSRPKYLMYVISEEGMSTHTPAAPSWVLLQNAEHCSSRPALQMQLGTSQQTAATSDLQPEFCENVQRKLKISSLLLPRTLALMAGRKR